MNSHMQLMQDVEYLVVDLIHATHRLEGMSWQHMMIVKGHRAEIEAARDILNNLLERANHPLYEAAE